MTQATLETLPGRVLGTADQVGIVTGVGRIEMRFRSEQAERGLLLTKFPRSLALAILSCLTTQEEGFVEFAGENYSGRVGFSNLQPNYGLVLQFSNETPMVGYLIHLDEEDLTWLATQFHALHRSDLPTD